jgi:Rrf2 family protein
MLTRAADYAVRVMIHMATLPEGTRVVRSALASATDVPDSFMSKVLQSLARKGMISSRRGIDGGFVLTVSPGNISLLEIVEAIDGPMQLNDCVANERTASARLVARRTWCGKRRRTRP